LKEIIIAKRYAKAALQCLKPNDYKVVSKEVYDLRLFFDKNPQIQKYISSPMIKKEEKISLFNSIIEEYNYKDFWNRTFNIIISKQRSDIIPFFLKMLDILLIDALDQLHIDLILAHEQDSHIVDLIEDKLSDILGRRVVSNIIIDDNIIGGFIGITQNQIVDASVKSQLNRFMKRSKV